MEIKLISKTKKGEEALKKMYKEQHNKRTAFFRFDTFVDSVKPYTLKIVWSGQLAKALDKTPTGREQLKVGIKPLVPKYGCTDKDIEVV